MRPQPWSDGTDKENNRIPVALPTANGLVSVWTSRGVPTFSLINLGSARTSQLQPTCIIPHHHRINLSTPHWLSAPNLFLVQGSLGFNQKLFLFFIPSASITNS